MRISSLKIIFVVMLAGMSLAGCNGSDYVPSPAPTPANKKPAANAGPDHRVDEKQTDTLKGAGSDSDGTIAAYSWTQVSGPDVKLTASDSDPASVTYSAPDVVEATTLAFKLTVTDDAGATATDTVNVTVAPTVSLQGKVVDGPIGGATVTVTIGDKTYTATAGADGSYTLDVGAVDPDAFITITATGTGGQSNVQLISIAGTFGALADAAGDDAILAPSESDSVDVTNLSTAQAVLILAANDGDTPTDDAALTDLQKSVDGDALLELATVIKLVVDEGVPLPDGVDNTLDLVQDDAAVDDVIDTANATNPDLFDATMNEILDDPALASAFTADTVPPQYFVNQVGGYTFANRGYTLNFNTNGTGKVFGADAGVSADFTWTIDADGKVAIHIAEADPLTFVATCAKGLCRVDTTDMEISLVTDGAVVDTVAVRKLGTITYFDTSIPPEAEDTTQVLLGMAPGALEQFTAAEVTGTWSVPLSLPDPDGGGFYVTDLLTFNADGSGMRPADGATFQWKINTDTDALNIDFSTGDALDIYWLRSDGELGIDAMMSLTTGAGDVYTLPQLIVRGVDSSFAGNLTLADFDGPQEYMDWGTLDVIFNAAAGTAAWTYFDDSHVITNQYGPDGVAYDGIKITDINWVSLDGPPTNVSSCVGVTACYEAREDKWYPLAKDSSGRIFVLEDEHDWDFDSSAVNDHYRGAVTYHDHVNRWFKSDPVTPSAPTTSNAGFVQTHAMRGERVREALGAKWIKTRKLFRQVR
ncbi:MAG TPA: hypothetical protein VFH85_01385 [Gammaproteobacteria bacterium]|nr:hypothetical protein [Gammaproteobacteria bacterium]